jgi:hypothetical protein
VPGAGRLATAGDRAVLPVPVLRAWPGDRRDAGGLMAGLSGRLARLEALAQPEGSAEERRAREREAHRRDLAELYERSRVRHCDLARRLSETMAPEDVEIVNAVYARPGGMWERGSGPAWLTACSARSCRSHLWTVGASPACHAPGAGGSGCGFRTVASGLRRRGCALEPGSLPGVGRK